MTNETKQTAVDILFDRIKLKADSISMNTEKNRMVKGAYVDCLMLIREAKEMEKKQHRNTWNNALEAVEKKLELLKQTYGGNK